MGSEMCIRDRPYFESGQKTCAHAYNVNEESLLASKHEYQYEGAFSISSGEFRTVLGLHQVNFERIFKLNNPVQVLHERRVGAELGSVG